MDDMTAFERQLADEIRSLMGHVRPVDDLVVFEAVVATNRQQGWGFTMFSALKFVIAGVIVALFGGFLLASILTTQQSDEAVPAVATESPSPITTGGSAFPTGTFAAEEDGVTLEFRADGTCLRAGVPCTYGVRGNLYSEMTFEDPEGTKVPATYYWDWDGEQLTFASWGIDKRPDRQDTYADHTYRPVGETQPLPATETDFPTGNFVAADDSDRRWSILDDGRWYNPGSASYVVNGNLVTELAFTPGQWNVELIPATYFWLWDGQRLSFRLWGEDTNRWRTAQFLEHAYVRDAAVSPAQKLLLSHPQLDVWVTVEIRQAEGGGYEVTATVDGEPLGEGVGDTRQEAVKAALEPLGEPYASDMAATVKG